MPALTPHVLVGTDNGLRFTESPRWRAGEPCQAWRAGTRWPAARADWPST